MVGEPDKRSAAANAPPPPLPLAPPAELRKALAAHRLALRDAEAVGPRGGRGPASLADRMASRLAEMEAEVRRVESAAQ